MKDDQLAIQNVQKNFQPKDLASSSLFILLNVQNY